MKSNKASFRRKRQFTWSYLDWRGRPCQLAQPGERETDLKGAQKLSSRSSPTTFIFQFFPQMIFQPVHWAHASCLSVITVSGPPGHRAQPSLTRVVSALRRSGMEDETVLLSYLTKCKCGLSECVERGNTHWTWAINGNPAAKKSEQPRNNKALFKAGNRKARSSE